MGDDAETTAKKPVSGFPALSRLGQRLRRRQIPVVLQMNMVECGAASLVMVLAFHGKEVRLDQVRERIGVSRDGTNALAILNAARSYKLRARGAKLDIEDFAFLEEGSILHWGFNHFLVFERMDRDVMLVVDPAVGRRRIPLDEVKKAFTGVALLFEPSDGFEPDSSGQRPVWRYLKRALREGGRWPRIVVTSLTLQIFALAVPMLTGSIVDRVVPRGDSHLLVVLTAASLSIVVFNFLASITRAHLLLQVRTHLDVQMTVGFLEHMVSLPFAFFQKRSAGDLIMRLNSNSTIREILTAGTLSALIDGLLVFFYLMLLVIASPLMGGVVFLLGLLQVGVFILSEKRQRELMSETLHVQSRSQSYQVEMLAGMESLKAMGAEKRATEYFTKLFVDALNVSIERGRLGALIESTLASIRLGSPLIVLALGAMLVLRGEMSLGTMLTLNALAAGFLVPLATLVGTAEQFQLLGSYISRLDDVFGAAPEQDEARVVPAEQLTGAICLESVSFRYAELGPLVVRDVSVDVKPGQFVALVGPSGSGKSTLASLLLALYRPTSGRILYDGRDLAGIDARSVRRQFGVVMQRPYLFAASVRENITLTDPSMPLDAVIEAAMVAQIHDEVAAMPMGYETVLSDAGTSISGGQRQRITLARALVRKPSIVLLDEATSALDAATEARVQEAIESMRSTRIVIAHRLSTIVKADLILMMKDGTIVERGTHDELFARRGAYHDLVVAQLAQEGPRLDGGAKTAEVVRRAG